MNLSISEKIKVIMNREGVNMTELAERVGQSRQNLSYKLNRNNLTEEEAKAIASALGWEFAAEFRRVDGSVV